MPVTACADDARPSRRRASSNGADFWLTTYIGANRYTSNAGDPPAPGAIYPMAFLVEQDAGAVVGAHYHQADQFQVVVGGAGRLGRHDVTPGAVHFAGAWSPYGPLSAGSDGLQYFTLRNGWDPGARYMAFPDNRAALRATSRRHREMVGEIEASPDGLGTKHYDLAADEAVTGTDPASGLGQFWVILAGTLRRDGTVLPARSCVFVYPYEPAFGAIAGADGARVLSVQYPRR